ncbi:MAG: class I SAM-dependent methyltransferase [Blastocatellia bacterium]|nr:class I SAM-dependent methyltransferase [Blastocatellia bacterium]
MQELAQAMKRDWDERAREDARWYINTLRHRQSDEEFDQTGAVDVERLVRADLPLLTGGREAATLRALEIGCGAGRMTRHLAGIFAHVTGIDVSGEMIRQARERLAGIADKVDLRETNGVDLALFDDEAFDLILSAYVFQHVPSAEVIASNVREAWRVLAPGGVFKFQTSAVAAPEFERAEKDTWSGATFGEDRIREFARAVGAQLIGIFGANTQYCWTLLRKRAAPVSFGGPARIVAYGRTVDAARKRIPIAGDAASLTVILAGPPRDAADCNSVWVELGERAVQARYVGPIGRNFEAEMRAGAGDSLAGFTQVEIGIPEGLVPGVISVRVRIEGMGESVSCPIVFEAPQPYTPRIGAIMNMADDGLEVFARGEKSRLRILVENLAEGAAIDAMRVVIGERVLSPDRIAFLPGNVLHEVEIQLPDDIATGSTEARIVLGELASPAYGFEIR